MNLIFEPQFLNLIAKAPHRMDHRSTAPIRIAIVGHGNLGRGVEAAIARNPDMVLAGIYTRRDPAQLRPLQPGTPVHGMDSLLAHRAGIDVLVLCGGSKDDLPQQSPRWPHISAWWTALTRMRAFPGISSWSTRRPARRAPRR